GGESLCRVTRLARREFRVSELELRLAVRPVETHGLPQGRNRFAWLSQLLVGQSEQEPRRRKVRLRASDLRELRNRSGRLTSLSEREPEIQPQARILRQNSHQLSVDFDGFGIPAREHRLFCSLALFRQVLLLPARCSECKACQSNPKQASGWRHHLL